VTGYGLYRRLRYLVGNGVRAASIPWKQHRIDPAEATTIFGCSYGDDGWHHIRRTLAEYDARPDIGVRETTLFRYLTEFCPSSICDLASWASAEAPLPLFVYPWGTFRKGETQSPKNAANSRFSGPSSHEFVGEEFARTIKLYERMKRVGYQPWRFPNSFIGGTMLVRANGERRFVVMQGNHRMAVLAHLGATGIAVRDVPGNLPWIRETDVSRWPLVADGTCRPESALRIFNFFFESTGHRIAEQLRSGPLVSTR
jgi:hypothetical protein